MVRYSDTLIKSAEISMVCSSVCYNDTNLCSQRCINGSIPQKITSMTVVQCIQ